MGELRARVQPWLALLALAVLAWFVWRQFSPPVSADTPTPLRYEASDLATRFARNPAAAHAGIDGRVVEVHGRVHLVSVVGGAPVLSIGVLGRNVDCLLPRDDMRTAGRLARGTAVQVKGRVVAVGDAVVLRPCVLV